MKKTSPTFLPHLVKIPLVIGNNKFICDPIPKEHSRLMFPDPQSNMRYYTYSFTNSPPPHLTYAESNYRNN